MDIKKIKPQNLKSVYMEIATAYDVDMAMKIKKLFGGQKVSFPKKLFNNDFVYTYIKSNYNGSNMQELSKMFGVSERRIRQILSKFK